MEEVARFFSGSVPIGRSAQPQTNSFPPLSPQLFIIGQKTHCDEVISKNGLPKTVHTVVKNSPFHITIGLNNATSSLDFNRIAFDASLVYDEGGKEVDYVKNKPIEFKPVPSQNGNQLDCETRIKVLTSHHEDLLFKIKIQGFNPTTKQEVAGLMIYSFPIKVISKPEQLKKRPPSKKRSLNDMLVETITRIEKKQAEQQALIEKVLNQQLVMPMVQQAPIDNTPAKRSRHDLFWDIATDSEDCAKDKDDKCEKPVDFESAFTAVLKAYNAMSQEEKPETVRRITRNSTSRETERLSEMLDLFWTEGLLKERSFGQNVNSANIFQGHTQDGCCCSECPHKSELERIDEFYKEFLQTGIALPGF
eukprot:TRINITY_DN579_c0_g1_i1.p1 TRINITY_DN579_c0_g1~~TRINITY_DN579_c0_g1_i1.p1  ORF type:complete len:406 (+),score=108.67 TRINITY_DN579_c0_g1_i1:132-1220(+)